jgi:hypothetical protein
MTGSRASLVRFANDTPRDALFARVQTAIANTRSSNIGTRTRVLIAVTVAAALGVSAVLVASQLVYHRYAPGLEARSASAPYMIVALLLLGALTVVATVVATWRGRWGFGSGARSLYLTSALVAPIYAVLVALTPLHEAYSRPDGAIPVVGLRCLTLAAVVGLAVLAAFTIALRHSVPVRSGLRGAAIGAAAGAWAGLSVFIFCPSDDLRHLFIAHVLPIAGFTALGLIIVPRALRL